MPPDHVAASGRRASSPSTDVSRHPHSARPQLLQPRPDLAQAGSDGGGRVLHSPIPPALPVSSNVSRHGSSQSANLGPIWAKRPRLAIMGRCSLAGTCYIHARICGCPVVYAPVVYAGCGTSRSCWQTSCTSARGPARSTRRAPPGQAACVLPSLRAAPLTPKIYCFASSRTLTRDRGAQRMSRT